MDITKNMFNSCGIDALPFVRPLFFDMDRDGHLEMIAGSRDGSLRLYKNDGTAVAPQWRLEGNFFNGVEAAAFSSPAAGDIDNDGYPEIFVGTGGFSSGSGKVILYKNFGMPSRPIWRRVEMPEIDVGNDATPSLADVDNDGRPDLVVGNSEGRLFLFRNITVKKELVFRKDAEYFSGVELGMYAVPAVSVSGKHVSIIAGNSLGKLYLLERTNNRKSQWRKEQLAVSVASFAAPTFLEGDVKGRMDMIVSDGNGQLSYFNNRKDRFREWEERPEFFNGRILPGPACAPAMAETRQGSFMVVGNIMGEIRLFEYTPSVKGLPWKERTGFFRDIKLPGFSRGVLTEWQGRLFLITGEQDGIIRAFLNSGTFQSPIWREEKDFFMDIPKIAHAAPFVFDIDGDGRWELIVGGEDGSVNGFRYETVRGGLPQWQMIRESFSSVRVDRFAAPTLFRDAERLYLLAGQQDGRIYAFTSDPDGHGLPVFSRGDYLSGIKVNNHSSPSAVAKNGNIEISVGDYNGNLRHYACEKSTADAAEN
ncbi:MAG: VCBS repeat-containing protein [Nitrospirae bacterium]|nr:VCBS repeat-containing protein [Nitrospirota bacterium]